VSESGFTEFEDFHDEEEDTIINSVHPVIIKILILTFEDKNATL
jgi:hypothetical protein